MKPQGDDRRERLMQELDYLIARGQEVAEQIRQVDAATAGRGRHAAERPHLTLIRGGKALILAPFLWVGAHLRDHSVQAAGLAAAGVVGVPVTLGVASPAGMAPVPPPPTAEVVEHAEPRPSRGTPTPTPAAKPDLNAPTPHPILEPETWTPSPTPSPTAVEDLLDELPLSPLPTEIPLPSPLPTVPVPTLPPVEIDPLPELELQVDADP